MQRTRWQRRQAWYEMLVYSSQLFLMVQRVGTLVSSLEGTVDRAGSTSNQKWNDNNPKSVADGEAGAFLLDAKLTDGISLNSQSMIIMARKYKKVVLVPITIAGKSIDHQRAR